MQSSMYYISTTFNAITVTHMPLPCHSSPFAVHLCVAQARTHVGMKQMSHHGACAHTHACAFAGDPHPTDACPWHA